MPHNPVKSIKIDFHTADGVTPKETPLPDGTKTSGTDSAPEKVPTPQTKLSPIEEALFPHWATANGVDESAHSDPNNHYDFRGMYKQTGGKVMPTGTLSGASDMFNKLQTTQHPAISGMLDMMKQGGQPPMVPSHNTLSAPGIPSVQQATQGKIDSLQGMDGSQEPIQQLLSMIRSSVR